MELVVYTDSPQDIIEKFNDDIKKKSITDWERNANGDYTYVIEGKGPYYKKAWIHVEKLEEEDKFRMTLKGIKGDKSLKKETIQGVYFGRFIEMLISRFEQEIDKIRVNW